MAGCCSRVGLFAVPLVSVRLVSGWTGDAGRKFYHR